MKALVLTVGCVLAAALAMAPAAALARQGGAGEPYSYVKMATSLGDIYLELNRAKAPITVDNFLRYVDKGFFDGTIFHRVMPNFVIQGGGFTKDMVQKPTDPGIKNEWRNGLQNKRGTISMARLSGQADSATSQFFISVVDNAALDSARDGAAYAVFGHVIKGMDVVDKIKAVKTISRAGHQDVPEEPVVIQSAKRADPSELSSEIKSLRDSEADAATRAQAARDSAISDGLKLLSGKGVDTSAGQTRPSGLWVHEAKSGDGAQAALGDQVSVHYTVWLTNGTQVDSSAGKPPASFRLAEGSLIKGWLEGVPGMKVGGKRYLVVPPELAYGAAGRQGIPPNSVLAFEIELVGVAGK